MATPWGQYLALPLTDRSSPCSEPMAKTVVSAVKPDGAEWIRPIGLSCFRLLPGLPQTLVQCWNRAWRVLVHWLDEFLSLLSFPQFGVAPEALCPGLCGGVVLGAGMVGIAACVAEPGGEACIRGPRAQGNDWAGAFSALVA